MYILFDKRFVDMILSGEKTQTRRSIVREFKKDTVYAAKTDPDERPFAWLRVMAIKIEWLDEITDVDVLSEGFETREQFLNFCSNHLGMRGHISIQAISFEVVDIKTLQRKNNP